MVEQDGVQVVIDSKALFSIIGSEIDWKEDPLRCAPLILNQSQALITYHIISSKFVFANLNITDACGCGESFTVGS